jgi:hypothetical protein
MESDNIYRKIQEFFGGVNPNFSLMEEPVDVAVQMKYFETSGRMSEEVNEEDLLARKDELLDPKISVDKKKALLVQLASLPNPEIYRILEAYAKEPAEELREWAKLALQENKLMLESHLLDNRQVFISTGLGGKGHKLRYFAVLINKNGNNLKPFEQKVVQDEMQYMLQRCDGELEKLVFMQQYTTLLVVAPLNSDITRVFRDGIDECNQFGDFLLPDFIITNMKELSEDEINKALSANRPITDEDFPPVE